MPADRMSVRRGIRRQRADHLVAAGVPLSIVVLLMPFGVISF
jgi:hypothetical protein